MATSSFQVQSPTDTKRQSHSQTGRVRARSGGGTQPHPEDPHPAPLPWLPGVRGQAWCTPHRDSGVPSVCAHHLSPQEGDRGTTAAAVEVPDCPVLSRPRRLCDLGQVA